MGFCWEYVSATQQPCTDGTAMSQTGSLCKIQYLSEGFLSPHSTQTVQLIKITMINRSESAPENVPSHGRPPVSHV